MDSHVRGDDGDRDSAGASGSWARADADVSAAHCRPMGIRVCAGGVRRVYADARVPSFRAYARVRGAR